MSIVYWGAEAVMTPILGKHEDCASYKFILSGLPKVFVMQTAEVAAWPDGAAARKLNWPRLWRILFQRKMRANSVVIVDIFLDGSS